MTTDIQKITSEVTKELANKETLQALVSTTFKKLEVDNVKKAIVEGMIRGFTFQDFLEKNVYAIPFDETQPDKTKVQRYSLVTSVDYARKIGMRSGVVGKSAPEYEEKEGRIISCTVTIKRKVDTDIGEFSAKVYFAEYTTGKNLWTSKPRTMIAKVAEMHALRMACPEELSQMYTAEEMGEKVIEAKVTMKTAPKIEPIDVEIYGKKLEACKTSDELKTIWSAIPFDAKVGLETLKNQIKVKLTK